jgi:hypothetical protein
MISRLSSQRLTHPEQVVPAGEKQCPESRQDALAEVQPPVQKTVDFDNVYLVSNEPDVHVLHVEPPSDDGFSLETGGTRHFRYRLPPSPQSNYSTDGEMESESEEFDEKFTRSCIAALSNLLARRLSRAMIDLVGIEPNPGPRGSVTMGMRSPAEMQSLSLRNPQVKKKKKTKKVRNPSTALVVYKAPKNSTSARTSGGLSAVRFEGQQYWNVLNNPWDKVPVRLGGETMQPSGLATCISRWVGNTDSTHGCYSLVYYPWANNPLMESNSFDSPYSYNGTTYTFPQGPGIGALSTGGRIVAAGIRVTSLQSSTSDQGLITIGCLPRDSAAFDTTTHLSSGGFPWYTAAAATQGFNEFQNYLQTETFPFRCGASSVWRPEDPLDFEFRTQVTSGPNTPDITSYTPLCPFFVVGFSGTAPSAQFLVEMISHIEYTINEGTTGVVNTAMGNMSSVESCGVAKKLFGGLVNTAFQGISGGLSGAAGGLLKAGIGAAGSYFESSVRGLT